MKKRKDPIVGTGKKPKGSDRRLYTDENPKDTVPIKFATVADARKTIAKVMKINKPYARKVQILTVLEQRAKVMGKMEQARLAKSAKSTLKSKNEKSSPAKLLKGKKKKQKDNKKQTNNTVTIPDNAITASHSDQAIAKKKFQRANNNIIPKGTKVTFNKTTGKYTYYYVPSDSPVKKTTDKDMVKASNGAMVPKIHLKEYEQSIKQAKIELAKEKGINYGGKTAKEIKLEDRVEASNGAMVPRSEHKRYEQSLAKYRVARDYKEVMLNPVFREVATTGLLWPIKAFNIAKKAVSYGKKLDRLSKAKKTLRTVDAVNDVRQLKNKR